MKQSDSVINFRLTDQGESSLWREGTGGPPPKRGKGMKHKLAPAEPSEEQRLLKHFHD